MYTIEEQAVCDKWWSDVGIAFKSLPIPTTPGAEAEAGGMKFRTERWRDGITFQWCLSWQLLNTDGTRSRISGARHVDPNQTAS